MKEAVPMTADCSDDGLTAPLCRPPCLTARIVSHLLVAECMPSCVHRATRFNTIATRCRSQLLGCFGLVSSCLASVSDYRPIGERLFQQARPFLKQQVNAGYSPKYPVASAAILAC